MPEQSDFSGDLRRLVGKISGLFESKDPVSTLPRDVPVSELPAFIQPAVQAAHTKYYKGSDPDSIAYTPAGTTGAIYVVRPKLFNKDIQAHEATHIYQNTLRHGQGPSDKYDYGGWGGLEEARKKGKTIADFSEEQQASMIGDYTKLINYLNSAKFKNSDPTDQAADLRQLDLANKALGPFIHQLAQEPKLSDPTGSMFHPETLDLKKLNPPAPGPPPSTLTGVGVPLPEYGGHSVFTPSLSKGEK